MESLLKQIKLALDIFGENHAFCFDKNYYSYNEFKNRICNIIVILRKQKLDASQNNNIGIITNNDLDTYASLIACWFMGYAYVPLNPTLPSGRKDAIISEAGINLILSSTDIGWKATDDLTGQIVVTSEPSGEATELEIPIFQKERNAYIIFTSGSTGIPKGVPITHSNIESFIENFCTTEFKVEQSDRCLQMFELSFDVSISSFLIPLLKGACVFPVGYEGIRYVQVLKFIQEYKLTSLQIVPSVIRLAGPLLKRLKFPWVKNCIVTGEATFVDLIPAWQSCVSNAQIFNFYGPTETTIYCSIYKVDKSKIKEYNGMISIGKPMGCLEILILDEDQNEIKNSDKGELYVGGRQLSNGYLNMLLGSGSSFIKLPSGNGKTFYKSGDVAFKDVDGDLFYCGRFDNQVKIQGFRIELGEIEYLVRTKFGLNNVALVGNKRNEEVLLLILEYNQDRLHNEIFEFLKDNLPSYMVPEEIFNLVEFPLTSSGKTDRRKLKEIISVGI